MTMPEVVFEDPSPSHGRGSTARVLAVRAAIDARPGEWALLPTGMADRGIPPGGLRSDHPPGQGRHQQVVRALDCRARRGADRRSSRRMTIAVLVPGDVSSVARGSAALSNKQHCAN